MGIFNIYYKNKLGPNSFESIIAEVEEEAIKKFKEIRPNTEIVMISKPKGGDRRW
jgi:hypothetical protein